MFRDCTFCKIAQKLVSAAIVFEDELHVAFLDSRPLFPGHTLLIPRAHYESFSQLPIEKIGPFFTIAQLLSASIEAAMNAEGTFIAINNKVSQSIPHLHLHIVPRKKRDGLRGFFWPRKNYINIEQMNETVIRIQKHITDLSMK